MGLNHTLKFAEGCRSGSLLSFGHLLRVELRRELC